MRIVIISIFLVISDIISASNFAIQPYSINFNKVPLSQTVLAGANVSFSCSAAIVDEQTLPQFIWYHNNTEITNRNVSYTGINMSTLFISNATEMDQGEYYCIVKDWETRTKSESGKLTVYGDSIKSQHLNVTLNETVVLQCNSDGIQSEMIQWLWNGSTIDLTSKRYHKLQDGSLVILHANSSDDGEYSCEGTVYGGRVKMKSYEMHSVSAYRNNETVSLYPERSTRFFENMTILCHIPSSLEFHNVMWIRNGTTLSLPIEDIEVVEHNLIKIRSMSVSAHEYKCKVYKSSLDEFPATSSSLIVYNYYSVPVVEHSNTTDYYICANLNSTDFSCVNGSLQTVNLYCNSVGGIPTPTVTWYHNGAEIINANVLNGTLMLNKSACDLLGTYQCVMSNEVGSKITVFRVLPFGWLNAPSIPELSTKGRMLYINWKTPVYLGGLNSSLISYKMYKLNFGGPINLHDERPVDPQEYSCGNTQCNFTILDRDLRNGGVEKFYVSLHVAKSMNMMCQGYNTPDIMTSKSSEILFKHIVEYGPPKVNLSCSDEGYAVMTSEPTGNLPAKELQDGHFILRCTADWTCTNGTAVIRHQSATLRSTGMCDFNLRVSWRLYSCSVSVTYTYHHDNQEETVLKNCSSKGYDVHNLSSYTQDNASVVLSPTSSVNTTPNRVFQLSSFSENIPLVTTSESVMMLVTLNKTSSFVVSQTTTQLTIQSSPSLSPIEDKSSIVGSDLVVTTSSLIITLVFITIFIIVIGFVFKWKRKQRRSNIYGSLDSIPKAYSYIGREDQSICEKPHARVVKWISSIDESEETEYIDNDLSNEEMLNYLYGVETIKPVCSDNEKNVDTRGGSDDDQTLKNSDNHKALKFSDSATPSTLSLDCACNSNTYGYKAVTENHSDDPMFAYYIQNSDTPGNDMKYVQVSECQDQNLNAEIQSSAVLGLQCNTDIHPTHQPIHELTPKNQNPYPYVSLNFANTSKSCTSDSDTKTILHDNFSIIDYVDIQETNLI